MSAEKSFVVPVQEDDSGECFIEFPSDVLEQLGWQEGDVLDWKVGDNGEVIVTKKETEFVLVEALSQYRMRYVVEVPKGKKEWAADTVTCEEVEEFSQLHLGEVILSTSVLSRDEVLALCDEDNQYASSWSEEKKIQVFTKPWKEPK